MPKIQFSDPPRDVWHHLLHGFDAGRISVRDLLTIQAWVRSGPVAPDGDWYKDFGSFFLCGTGKLPMTILEKGMKPSGDSID